MNSNLEEQADKLQKDTHLVLEKLQLLDLLKKYGSPEIIGSVALGLMTWRDIDIEIVVEELKREDLAEIIATLAKKPLRRIDFSVSDNRSRFGTHAKIPNSLYIGMKYFGDDIHDDQLLSANPDVWKIDLHFLLEEDARGRVKTAELKSKLTEEKRKIILEIKNEIASHPKYRKEIFSMDIYQAVLDHGVTNLEEFREYLKRTGREL